MNVYSASYQNNINWKRTSVSVIYYYYIKTVNLNPFNQTIISPPQCERKALTQVSYQVQSLPDQQELPGKGEVVPSLLLM